MRGRKQILKLVKGTAPRPLVEIPPPPEHLSATAAAEWRRVAPILQKMGTLTEADLSALEQRCVCYASWREAEEKLAEFGAVVASPSGYAQPSPWGAIARQALDRCVKFDRLFGLVPESRKRLRIQEPKQQTPEQQAKAKFFGA